MTKPLELLPSPVEHTLTLEFGRFLSESEWREVATQAKGLPYVQGLRANAEPFPWHLWRGECGHHWLKDESEDCPICSMERNEAAPDMLALLEESQRNLTGDWRERRDALLERLNGDEE